MQNIFPSFPNVDCYFPALAMEKARTRLTEIILGGAGPGLLIGAAGCGKSLLLLTLTHLLDGEDTVERAAVLDFGPITSTRSLLQSTCYAAEVEYEGRDEGEMALALQRKFREVGAAGKTLVLLVDDAQSIPQAILEELRLLTSVSVSGRPVVSLVLAGTSSLEEQFSSPALECFQQRIAARCYLAPMNREETKKYFISHLQQTSETASLPLEAGVTDAVFEITDGVPRLINQLGSAVLNSLAEDASEPVTVTQVQRAWAESQQLPGMWEAIPDSTQLPEVANEPIAIEFGTLGSGELSESQYVERAASAVDVVEVPPSISVDQTAEVVGPNPSIDLGDAAAANLAAASLQPGDTSSLGNVRQWNADDPSLLEPFAPVGDESSPIQEPDAEPVSNPDSAITTAGETSTASQYEDSTVPFRQETEVVTGALDFSAPWPTAGELAQQGVYVEESMLTGSFQGMEGSGVEEIAPAQPLGVAEDAARVDGAEQETIAESVHDATPSGEIVPAVTTEAEQVQIPEPLISSDARNQQPPLVAEVMPPEPGELRDHSAWDERARDPFDAPYQEEEILLNNYALLGEVLLQGRTRVTSSIEDGISSMVRSVMESVDVGCDNETEMPTVATTASEDESSEEEETQWESTQVSEVLVIEHDDDESLVRAGIGRGEYVELLAQLRGE